MVNDSCEFHINTIAEEHGIVTISLRIKKIDNNFEWKPTDLNTTPLERNKTKYIRQNIRIRDKNS